MNRVRRERLNLDKGLDKLGEIPDLNLGDGDFGRARFVPSNDKLAAPPPPQSQRGAGMPDSDGKIC